MTLEKVYGPYTTLGLLEDGGPDFRVHWALLELARKLKYNCRPQRLEKKEHQHRLSEAHILIFGAYCTGQMAVSANWEGPVCRCLCTNSLLLGAYISFGP